MQTRHLGLLAGIALLAASRPLTAQTPDACALLSTADVQQAFPGSKPGQVDRALEKNGIYRCVWAYPTGRVLLITGKEADESPREEMKTWMMGFLDPLRGDAERNVRIEALPGVGDEAVAVVERADKAKGIAQNGAAIVVRRGKRQVSVLAFDLAGRERADALRILSDLGRAIAKRLG